jgi:hypothetical protein
LACVILPTIWVHNCAVLLWKKIISDILNGSVNVSTAFIRNSNEKGAKSGSEIYINIEIKTVGGTNICLCPIVFVLSKEQQLWLIVLCNSVFLSFFVLLKCVCTYPEMCMYMHNVNRLRLIICLLNVLTE